MCIFVRIINVKPMRTTVCILVLLSLNLSLFGQATHQSLPLDPAVRYGKLDNGLTYYIRHNQQPKERAEFYIAQNVGAILEEDDQNGLAHFLEHMAFNGTRHYPGKQLINYFESIGVRFGANINAYTSLDETVYNLSDVPTYREGIIDSALLVLHDWSSFILLEDNEIDKERGVIREEWRQGQTASRRLWKTTNELVMAGSQYAKRDIIGDTAVINNFSYETLRNYYKKWYRPDLQAILVVGDIDVDQIETKIKALFADIPAPVNPAERTFYPVPDKQQPVAGVFTDPETKTVKVSLYYLYNPLPDSIRLTVQGYLANLLDNVISVMANDRFSELVREPGSPFSDMGGFVTSITRTKQVFAFIANPLSGKEAEARQKMIEEVERLKRFGFTAAEFERAKTAMLSSMEKVYNEREQRRNNALVREYTRHFTQAEGTPGIEWEYDFLKTNLPNLVLDQLNQIAKIYLDSKSIVYMIEGPEKEGINYPEKTTMLAELEAANTLSLKPKEDTFSDQPLIANTLKPGKIMKESFNEVLGFNEILLTNGIRILFKSTPYKEDEIRMTAWSEGGSSLVPVSDLPSTAYAVGVINQSGLGTFDQISLKKKLTGKLASVSPYINTYEEGFSGSSSVKDLETMLQLTHLYFTAPRKDAQAYERYIRMAHTAFENAALDPANAFNDSLNAIMYNHHPRLLPQNVSTIERINHDVLFNRFTERFANPGDFTFLFVGNINPDTFKPLVANYLGSLKTDKKQETWKDNHIRHVQGPLYREVEKELKIKKTTCYIHYLIDQPYTLDNNLQLTTLANLLRLRYTATIREEEGASYSVSVRGSASKRPLPIATLVVNFNTDPALYKRMLGIVHDELAKIANQGPNPEDISKVKLNLLKQQAENKQENAWWMQTISEYDRDGIDNLTGMEARIEALDGPSIQALAKRFIENNNVREIMLMPAP